MSDLHRFDERTERAVRALFDEALNRLRAAPALGHTSDVATVDAILGGSITPSGLGFDEAIRCYRDVIERHRIALDSPRFLAFIPAAPAPVAAAFDAVVSAASYSAESWLEAAGAVHAENVALSWLAALAGLPDRAGGCFVSGGSAGNFSALAVARDQAGPSARRVVVGSTAHSSVASALSLLRLEPIVVEEHGPLTGRAVESRLARDRGIDDVCALVASAGATNDGSIDELTALAAIAARHGWWFHVDAAYGGAALCVPELRRAFEGIEAADSLIVDPHKWLFGPLDCCALLYRDPARARAVHAQHASYLDPLHTAEAFNPADHAFHLTRRARGLPLWFALAVHGSDAFRDSVRAAVDLARWTADEIDRRGHPLELVAKPVLSVVLFRRDGWGPAEWERWSRSLLDDGVAFVMPTRYAGEIVGRFAFLHPDTTSGTVSDALDRAG